MRMWRRRRSILAASVLLLTVLVLEPGKVMISHLRPPSARVVAKISLENLVGTVPNETLDWIRECADRAVPIVILEPELLDKVQYLNDPPLAENSPKTVPRPLLRFGILESDIFDLKILFEISQGSGWTQRGSVNSSFIFTKNGFTILLSMIRRRRFYLFMDAIKIHGFIDEPSRAFTDLSFRKAIIEDAISFRVVGIPHRKDRYLWQLARSRFLDCTGSSQGKWSDQHVPLVPVDIVEDLGTLRDLLAEHGVTLILFGATALGWYRDCGFVQYITDLTVAFPTSEWSERVITSVQRSAVLKIHQIFGPEHDNPMQISVLAREIQINIFALHKERNYSWVFGMVAENVGRRHIYPSLAEICTADLYGHLFYVRCDILAELQSTYGPFWHQPYITSDQLLHNGSGK